ncbi:MAG TPA: glyoxalase [Spirochaetaceae bacterium]|nr:glyoxalase [Spirochaetaceae bacterium]
MQFCWVTIHVHDMEKSLAFYCDIVGLALKRQFSPTPGDQIAFLGSGDTEIELIHNEKNPPAPFSQNISLGFKVESLERTMEILKAHDIPVLAGPFQPNPNVKFFYVHDPNGLRVQFVQDID